MLYSTQCFNVLEFKNFTPPLRARFAIFFIMLRNGRILRVSDYLNTVSRDKINPKDAYVYISTYWTIYNSNFYYPFLFWYEDLISTYLSKFGFHYRLIVVPATGLKYVADATIDFYTRKYLTIELLNLDTAVNNTNLRTIMFEVLGDKLVSIEKELTKDELDKIYRMFRSQRLFAGHNFEEAENIIYEYYDKGNQSLSKEVTRIAMDYDRIFHPYTVCYETRTWKEVDCWSVKLD